MAIHVVPPPAAAAAPPPNLVDNGGGGLANSSYYFVAPQEYIQNGLVWQAWDLLTRLSPGPWLDGLKQYGVQSCSYAGFGSVTPSAGQPPELPSGLPLGTFPILICSETDAHAYDNIDGANRPGPYRDAWIGLHSDVNGAPYIVCPFPDSDIGGWSPLDIFTMSLTHELAELLTDAVPYTGWVFQSPNATTPDSEACDTVCMGHQQSMAGSNGGVYLVSAYWRNDQRACWTPSAPAAAAPPPPPMPSVQPPATNGAGAGQPVGV